MRSGMTRCVDIPPSQQHTSCRKGLRMQLRRPFLSHIDLRLSILFDHLTVSSFPMLTITCGLAALLDILFESCTHSITRTVPNIDICTHGVLTENAHELRRYNRVSLSSHEMLRASLTDLATSYASLGGTAFPICL